MVFEFHESPAMKTKTVRLLFRFFVVLVCGCAVFAGLHVRKLEARVTTLEQRLRLSQHQHERFRAATEALGYSGLGD